MVNEVLKNDKGDWIDNFQKFHAPILFSPHFGHNSSSPTLFSTFQYISNTKFLPQDFCIRHQLKLSNSFEYTTWLIPVFLFRYKSEVANPSTYYERMTKLHSRK